MKGLIMETELQAVDNVDYFKSEIKMWEHLKSGARNTILTTVELGHRVSHDMLEESDMPFASAIITGRCKAAVRRAGLKKGFVSS